MKQTNDLKILFGFLRSQNITILEEARCLDYSGNKKIVDFLYLNYQDELCCFEFRNKYGNIDLDDLLVTKYYKKVDSNQKISKSYLITPHFCLDLSLLNSKEKISEFQKKFITNPFDSFFDQYKIYELYSSKVYSESKLFNRKIDLNEYFIQSNMINLFDEFKDIISSVPIPDDRDIVLATSLVYIIKKFKESSAQDLTLNQVTNKLNVSDSSLELFYREFLPKNKELLPVYERFGDLFTSDVVINLFSQPEYAEKLPAYLSLERLGILELLHSKPFDNIEYSTYQDFINSNIKNFVYQYISLIYNEERIYDYDLISFLSKSSFYKKIASIYKVNKSKVLCYSNEINQIGSYLGVDNVVVDVISNKKHHIYYHLINLLNNNDVKPSLEQIDDVRNNGIYFDRIICCEPSIRTDLEFIKKFIERLSENGKGIIMVKDSFLWHQKRNISNMRNWLIDKNFLDFVINIPIKQTNNIWSTAIKYSLIGIDLKKVHDNVFFVDEEYNEMNLPRMFAHLPNEELINHPDYVNDYLNSRKESDGFRSISNKIIKQNNYDLNYNRYLYAFPPDYNKAIPLTDYYKLINRSQLSQSDEKGYFITARNLSSDSNENKNLIIPSKRSVLRRGMQKIDQDALLLTNRIYQNKSDEFLSLRPTIFRKKDFPIYIDSSILAFEIDEWVDNDHIKRTMMSSLCYQYLEDQIQKFKIGTTLPIVRKSDLLKFKLPISDSDLFGNRIKQDVVGNLEVEEKIIELESELKRLKKYKEGVQDIEHDINKAIRKLNRKNINEYGNIKGIRLIVKELNNYSKELEELARDESLKFNIESVDINSYLGNFFEKYKDITFVQDYSRLSISLDAEGVEPEITEQMEKSQNFEKNDDGKFVVDSKYKAHVFIDKYRFQKCLENMMENFIEHGFLKNQTKKVKITYDLILTEKKKLLLSSKSKKGIDIASYLSLAFYNNGQPISEEKIRNKSRKSISGNANRGRGLGIIEKNLNLMAGGFSIGISDKSDWNVVYKFTLPVDTLDIQVDDVIDELKLKDNEKK